MSGRPAPIKVACVVVEAIDVGREGRQVFVTDGAVCNEHSAPVVCNLLRICVAPRTREPGRVGRAVKRKHGKVSESIILQVLSYIPFLQTACRKKEKNVFLKEGEALLVVCFHHHLYAVVV